MVLCVPNVPRCPDNSNRLFTLALVYLEAAARRAGWECDLVDAYFENLSAGEAAERISAPGPPALIGFSLYTPGMWEESLLVLEALKRTCDRLPVVAVGGHYATFQANELLTRYPQIDYVIAGEGEWTFKLLLEALEGGLPKDRIPGLKWHDNSGNVHEGPPARPEPDPDKLGAVDFTRAAARLKPDEWSLSTSRGCPGSCSFCISSRHWGASGWRGHSPAWIVDRLAEIVRQYGATWVNFVDDNFFGDSDAVSRARAVSELMRERDVCVSFSIMARADTVSAFPEAFRLLRDAGLSRVFLGIESGNDFALGRMRKGIDSATGGLAVRTLAGLGIGVTLGNIVFHPWMTASSVSSDLDYLERLLRMHPGARFFGLNELDIFAPTPLGQTFCDQGTLSWLCRWEAEDRRLQSVLEDWRRVRSEILFPAMQILPPTIGGEIRRAYDFWQLEAVRDLIQGEPRERFTKVYGSMCRFLLKQGGIEVLDSFVSQRAMAGTRKPAPHPERCFA